MKPKIPFQFRSSLVTTIFCGALFSHFAASSVSGGTLYWDGNGAGAVGNPPTAAVGGAGTWDTSTTANWWTGTAYQLWNATGGEDIADFRLTGGTVTVSGTVNVNRINVRVPSYTFTGGTVAFGGSPASPGILDFTTAKTSATINFASGATGNLRVLATGNTSDLTSTIPLQISGATSLTSFDLALAQNSNLIALDNVSALGPASSTVKLTKGVLTLGFTAVSRSYNAWPTDLAGGTLRARYDSTWNGATSLSSSSRLTTRNAAAVALTFANTATINLNANTLSLSAGNLTNGITLNGVISGSGDLTTADSTGVLGADPGTGTTRLNAANTFSGTATTTTNLGTLALGNVDALQNATLNTGAASGTQGVTFTVAGTNIYNIGALSGADNLDNTGNTLSIGAKAADTSFSAILSGVGGLTKVGSNSLTLSGANDYTGATLVSGGTLNVSGSLTSAINAANNATVGGEGSTTGNVVMSTGSALAFDPTTTGANQYLRTTGTIDATAGGVKLKVTSAVSSGTGIVIAQADGGWGASTNANFTLLARGSAYLSGNRLLYDFGIGNVTWKGNAANPTFWDLATTQNWDNTGSPDVFLSGDNVTFGDSATTKVVAVQAALAAGTLSFTNTFGNDYSLSGAALNATSLTKSGSGKVTVSNAVTLSGAATISTGTLQLGDGTNATGSLSSAITNDGALITSFGGNNVTLANAISGTGSFTQAGTGTVTLTGTNSYGITAIDAGGTLQVGSGGTSGTLGSGAVTNNGALTFNRSDNFTVVNAIGGSGSLSKTGTGALTLSSANGYAAATTITTGALIVTADGALGTNAAGTTIAAGRSLGLSGGINYATTEAISGSGDGSVAIPGALTNTLRGFIQSVSGSNTFRGNIELNANGLSRIGTQAGASLTLTGTITQASGITTANILFRTGDTGGEFVTLSNSGNSFGGDSTVFTGASAGNYAGVRLGVTNGLPTNRTISGSSGALAGTALDLAGFDQSLNGLISGGGSTSLRIINTITGTPSTLTLNPVADKSSSNTTILGGGVLGVINVVKNGTFSQTISGANSYSGDTTVTAGTLSLGAVNVSNETSSVTIETGAVLNLNYVGTDTVNKLYVGGAQLNAGQYGNSSSVLPVIANSQITGTGTLTITSGPPVTGYASWINGFFPGETNPLIIGADADPDNDGIDNGVEMVIGGNPATGMDTAMLPTLAMVTDPVSTPAIPVGNYLLFTYRRSDLSVAGSVTSACETDTDLVGPWTTAIDGASGVVIQVDDNFTFTPPAGAATDRVRVYVPRGANTTLFGRLDVVVP